MRVFQSPAPPPTCFFCLNTLTQSPRNLTSFKCPHCLCWNRYDKTGQIISDEPAMRDESLNAASFAKRASPSKHRIPTAYGKGPFCHTCETNQLLLLNMLSNYLPSPEDPSYDTRVAEMPTYTASLQARYPPVCKDCQPTVDEELRKKEHMARTAALGGWLKQSQHVASKRPSEIQRGKKDILIWKARGAMWICTLAVFILVDLLGVLQYELSSYHECILLVPLCLLSLMWMFWDPIWLSAREARLQGRTFRVVGRARYIRCQMVTWLSRLVICSMLAFQRLGMLSDYISPTYSRHWYATALATETVLAIFSLGNLRIERPLPVRLLEPRHLKPEVPAEPSTDPDPLISSLSLSNQPAASSTNPIFGQPSFPAPEVSTEDMMDWTPTNATPERVQDREGWMRPQRFFPPEQPTGLEDLFEKAKLDVGDPAESEKQRRQAHEVNAKGNEMREVGLLIAAAASVILVAGLALYHDTWMNVAWHSMGK